MTFHVQSYLMSSRAAKMDDLRIWSCLSSEPWRQRWKMLTLAFPRSLETWNSSLNTGLAEYYLFYSGSAACKPKALVIIKSVSWVATRLQGRILSHQLSSSHKLLLRDPPDPCLALHPRLIVPTPSYTSLSFHLSVSFSLAHEAAKKVFPLLWNRQLEFVPSRKEPDCKLFVPRAISTEFTSCNRWDHASSSTRGSGLSQWPLGYCAVSS